jgi:hypothetical protein
VKQQPFAKPPMVFSGKRVDRLICVKLVDFFTSYVSVWESVLTQSLSFFGKDKLTEFLVIFKNMV